MKLSNLKTKYMGRHNSYYDEIDSTQNEIWRRVENKEINNGEIIIARIQTNGIGTHGRTCYTDEVGDIAFSIYVETNCNISKLSSVTMDIAEITKSIFKDLYSINIDIKEPNDLMINNKKIGGILTESKVIGETIKYLVIGIGINTYKKSFNNEIEKIATSINKEYGINPDNAKVITEFCNRFEKRIEEIRKD